MATFLKGGGGRGNESQKIQIHCDAMIWTHLSRTLVQQILRKVFNSSSLLLKLLGKQEKAGIDSAVAKKCSKKRRWQPLYTPHPSRKSLWLRVKRNVFLAKKALSNTKECKQFHFGSSLVFLLNVFMVLNKFPRSFLETKLFCRFN